MTRPTALGSLLLAIALLTMLAQPVSSQSRPSNRNGLRLKLVGHFDVPTFIAGVGQDPRRIVVVERRGTIRMVRDGRPLRRAFLDIRPRVSSGGERGLLSIAFPPDYALTGRFYVYYTARSGALTIDEYRRSAGDIERADPRTRRLVMAVPHPNRNHNSGQLQFGPDGYMYAGMGDGGRSGDRDGHAQDPRTRLGKILRFDPSGTRPRQRSSPPDNPFIGRPEVPPEIWAKGFRNPWRFSFDQLRGDLVIAVSARTRSRRSTSCPGARAAVRTSAGTSARAHRRSRRAAGRVAGAPCPAPSSRCSSTATPQDTAR